MSRTRRTFLAVAAVLLSPIAANAVPILDQDNFASNGGGGGLVSNTSNFGRAQTFTVGLAGLFDSLDVRLLGGSVTQARILATTNGTPIGGAGGSTVLATTSLVSSVGNILSFDFSASGLAVNVGDAFAIELIGSGTWSGSPRGTYAGGTAYFFNSDSRIYNWRASESWDWDFRTYVDVPASVPEPGTLALLGIGLLGMCAARRKSRSQA